MRGPWAWWRRRGRRRGGTGGLDPELLAAVHSAYERGTPVPEAAARAAAEAGDRRGMTVYGIGLGNRGEYEAAEHWLRSAMALGDLAASVVLGTLHLDLGRYAEAERVLRPAADRGHNGARLALREARARRNGHG
ncbi:sel1 repeat family protein [Streptomyces sp. XD-27]|uniref:sel1 repeat family protein n=1 Tax=Streptomyces sp. XD-27 TaxID=3062779 RepID=UPI0026F462D5|nr:sel1 repeat family protein [Streptomyces sp. XD-27]WKX73687.1 sel1 repeat family protein [Streptomyces sp. XD-27]